MSKSTLIKDIKKQPMQQQTTVYEPTQQSEEDVTVQEVLSEIERETQPSQQFAQQQQQQQQQSQTNFPFSSPNQFVSSDVSSQLLQQQMLQQQMLQHQIQQQQLKNEDKEKYDTFFNNTISKIKQLFTRDNNLFLLATVLYLTFTYVDVLKILKFDNLSIFEKYPPLINIVLSLIFGLTLVLIKPLM
jgi:hypothetical protein